MIVRPLIPPIPPYSLLPFTQLVRPTFALVTVPSSRGGTRTELGNLPMFDVALLPWPDRQKRTSGRDRDRVLFFRPRCRKVPARVRGRPVPRYRYRPQAGSCRCTGKKQKQYELWQPFFSNFESSHPQCSRYIPDRFSRKRIELRHNQRNRSLRRVPNT